MGKTVLAKQNLRAHWQGMLVKMIVSYCLTTSSERSRAPYPLAHVSLGLCEAVLLKKLGLVGNAFVRNLG